MRLQGQCEAIPVAFAKLCHIPFQPSMTNHGLVCMMCATVLCQGIMKVRLWYNKVRYPGKLTIKAAYAEPRRQRFLVF